MLAFVTVGSTRFDSLVNCVFSQPVLSSLRDKGYTQLIIQCGNSELDLRYLLQERDVFASENYGIHIECWKYKPSLRGEYERADLVISHAGSGSILEVLRLGKPLIVVPNASLLDDHQQELATALEEMNHLKVSTISDLARNIAQFKPDSFSQFPAYDGSRSSSVMNFFEFHHHLRFYLRLMKSVIATSVSGDPQEYENNHVHVVYDQIAPHFSSTRYRPWPIIAKFLSDIPSGWVGFDSGTGNGKYLPLPLDSPGKIWTIGLDRSRNLLEIARSAGDGNTIREVICGDVLNNVWRDNVFDYAISIATIHHLATPTRRKEAVQRLLQAVSHIHGRVLIYVWATEQDDFSKRRIPNLDSSSGSDVFVPWVIPKVKPEENAQVFNRYYHMFAGGELLMLVTEAAQEIGLQVGPQEMASARNGIEILQRGWERSNHYVELRFWTSQS
ncbi:hypothetical protein E1B28_008731 [Marasmius oreades]|uniref:UDP-N-acetylglucosamine transferase subunit ALG13 n=1 Tax=Marasmius oreades TaxID=181124 RepID=A0A9P7US23_9AGAR|nr:uncharacterized protein E1B28_008731 [Marasmius oreades]KAG7092372.1 hypothetical protein E1B28_008731 [Marasmius oreades]